MRHDPKIVNRVLELLRQFGWDAGTRKLQEEIKRVRRPEDQRALQLFAGWQLAERRKHDEADQYFAQLVKTPALAGWALYGQAFVQYRCGGEDHWRRCRNLLARAEKRESKQQDRQLRAAIAHLRGNLNYKEGNSTTALDELERGWLMLSKDDFRLGRIFDSFGMIYADKDKFAIAFEFYKRAIEKKEQHNDQLGLAVTNGQLGRLCLSWEDLDRAQEYFHEDLHLAKQALDEGGIAQMHDHLGQVELARGDEEASAGNLNHAKKHYENAAAWLDESIRIAEMNATKGSGWNLLAGFARKDRALVYLARNDIPSAETDSRKAEQWFDNYPEGLAHVWRLQASLLRVRSEHYEEALRLLHRARDHFEQNEERAELALTVWEMARIQRQWHGSSHGSSPTVANEYLEALKAAEASRRYRLVQRIERELREIDAEKWAKHVFQRVRGRSVKEDTTSLVSGRPAPATVLYFDLQGSTQYAKQHDPAEVMQTLNQLMDDLSGVLRRHEAQISSFRGDGFLALFEGKYHARRAVNAGLELFHELIEFNRPNRIFGLEPLVGRVGISTGEVVFGNVGTYDKMDFTAIGTTLNLGARLEQAATPGRPCISWKTHEDVSEHFSYADGNPRKVDCKGLGKQFVWDVLEPT